MMHFNVYSSKIGFSWLFHTVAFFIAMQQQWTTARSGYTGFVTAAPSKNTPGEMFPTSLSIQIGGSANITCQLSTPNSSKIWFYEVKSQRKVQQPTDEIMIVDEYTAILMINNAVEQKGFYQCKIGDQGIGESHLNVGTKPQNVTDFSCIVNDYDSMNCYATRPKNMIYTKFELEFRFPNDNLIFKCDDIDVGYNKLEYSVRSYAPVREMYLFTLRGINDLGENVQNFTINNHKIAIPSPPEINIQNITSDSVTITWQTPKASFYVKGLQYEIKISDDGGKTWTRKKLTSKNSFLNHIEANLYAFWHYRIKVRAKTNAASDDDNMWSEASKKEFHTIAKRPTKAPATPLGSFYIDSMETQLRLYWGQMSENEHNGPGFVYVVNEINKQGAVILTTKTNDTSTIFAWKNESMQEFIIKSANDLGETDVGNTIRVYRSASSRYELNENNIAKVYHNSSYTLSWSPPENIKELINYTVFWCLPKIELPNQCKGPISYKYVDKYTTHFTTEPKDRSLNLAISANYPNYNKGMQWARCSRDISTELMKMELEATSLNESSILVKWNSGSVCASILKGYNLTYCQVTEEGNCSLPEKTVELLIEKHGDIRNYTITNLPPFTKICLYMFMYTSNKPGRNSDKSCVRSKSSAPSQPKNLSFNPTSVTSKSAIVFWSPPEQSNGILSRYTVYWRKYPDYTLEKDITSANETSYTLTGLNSYSKYEVHVTAHNVEESRPSKSIDITTLIGIPTSPLNPTINENDTVIYWDQPHLPSGGHLFYVVALLRQDRQYNRIFERVSIIKGRSCRFQVPDCSNTSQSYAVSVRAVNWGEINEVDKDIVSVDKENIFDGAQYDKHFCESDEEVDSVDNFSPDMFEENGKFFFASTWATAALNYRCTPNSTLSIYVIALITVIAFAVYICYRIRNKYYKMKNIKVILPEGLVDQVSNYKLASNVINNGSDSSAKKEFHSDISRSNDCLVAFGHKENHNLIKNFHNGSTNALSCISSNSSSKDDHNEDQIGEHPSLETTNEELSSNSSSVSNSNLTYHDHHQIQRLQSVDSYNSACDPDDTDDDHGDLGNLQHASATQNSGYVTHNSQLLASILNATDRNIPSSTQFTTTFPAMANDGYIQPSAAKQMIQPSLSHHPPPLSVTLNGYTSIEALGKMATMPDEKAHHNVATSVATNAATTPTTTANSHSLIENNMSSTRSTNVPSLNTVSSSHHNQTSPVITELHESTSTDFNKDTILPPNGTNNVPSSLTSQQPNNNNNTIYGYVTQQQLANFGTNVALGKELNT